MDIGAFAILWTSWVWHLLHALRVCYWNLFSLSGKIPLGSLGALFGTFGFADFVGNDDSFDANSSPTKVGRLILLK
jgi:hypothetical protein